MKEGTAKNLIIASVMLVILTVAIIASHVLAGYRFEKRYMQLWELADRSSTISAKRDYLKQFVSALEVGRSAGEFSSHNAMILTTPANSFDSNLEAIRTLSKRLDDIQDMDPSSFQYNTAIQQITAQEQGEAHSLIKIFSGAYELRNYPWIWGWIGVFTDLGLCVSWVALIVWWLLEKD